MFRKLRNNLKIRQQLTRCSDSTYKTATNEITSKNRKIGLV